MSRQTSTANQPPTIRGAFADLRASLTKQHQRDQLDAIEAGLLAVCRDLRSARAKLNSAIHCMVENEGRPVH